MRGCDVSGSPELRFSTRIARWRKLRLFHARERGEYLQSDTPRRSSEVPPRPVALIPRRAEPEYALPRRMNRRPAGCKATSRTARRILANRKKQEEARCRLHPLQVEKAHDPNPVRTRPAGARRDLYPKGASRPLDPK